MERKKSIAALLSISAICLLLCAAYLISGYGGRSSFTIETGSGSGTPGRISDGSEKAEKANAPESYDEENSYKSRDPALLNINTATASELSSLPGMDIMQAEKIISYRRKYGNYLEVNELLHAGISDDTLEAIRNLLCV